MGGRPAEQLLRLPVRLRGIQLGRPVDLLVDLPGRRALGLDVLCGDETHRFLPLAAATAGDDEIAVASALTMLEETELAFYRDRASALSALRGTPLELGGRTVGELRDVVVGAGGAIEELVVDTADGIRRVRADENLALEAPSAA